MGYYSDFELTVIGPACSEYLIKEINDLDVFESGDEDGGYWFGNAKWYEEKEDMIRISSDFPEYLFTVERYGEDRDDFCRTYYKNGESHCCYGTMSFEPFDLTGFGEPKEEAYQIPENSDVDDLLKVARHQ